MSIRIRNNKYVVDYYPRGRRGKRVMFTLPAGTTEAQARQIEKELRARKKHAQPANPSGNISRLIKHYLAHCELHQSSDTAKDKRSHFQHHILPFFGHLRIADLTQGYVTAYKQQARNKTYTKGKNERRKVFKVTNRTISKGLTYFSAFLKWAEEELNAAPPQPLRFRKLPHTRPVPIVLSLEEAMAFINAADKACIHASRCTGNPKCPYRVPYNVMFKMFFYLGLRNRAVRHQRWEDVDWTKRAVKTVEKGGKVKWHPLPDDLFTELRSLHERKVSEWLYPSPRDPRKPVNNILKAVARAKQSAGITKRVYPHLLRHSLATHLVDSDVDIRVIQDMLGHSHISTTEWYTQVSLEKKRQALEKAGIQTSRTM